MVGLQGLHLLVPTVNCTLGTVDSSGDQSHCEIVQRVRLQSLNLAMLVRIKLSQPVSSGGQLSGRYRGEICRLTDISGGFKTLARPLKIVEEAVINVPV